MANMFGSLLNQLHAKRQFLRDSAIWQIWQRNNIPQNKEGYKIEERSYKTPDGIEHLEFRLYQLIDASVIDIRAHIESREHTGLKSLPEMRQDYD